MVRYQLLSRAGLWMFDLAATQIAQETIREHSRGVVNGQWRSVIAFFDMLTYVVAVIASSPERFWFLSLLSAISVGVAATLYTLAEGPCGLFQSKTIWESNKYSRVPELSSENNVSLFELCVFILFVSNFKISRFMVDYFSKQN